MAGLEMEFYSSNELRQHAPNMCLKISPTTPQFVPYLLLKFVGLYMYIARLKENTSMHATLLVVKASI
jgi:hypothetical protein